MKNLLEKMSGKKSDKHWFLGWVASLITYLILFCNSLSENPLNYVLFC